MNALKMENKHARNRKSPKNEQDFVNIYKQLNTKADKKNDGMDIAAVITKAGIPGHGLMKQDLNRGHDKDFHVVKSFIPDSELKKAMKQGK